MMEVKDIVEEIMKRHRALIQDPATTPEAFANWVERHLQGGCPTDCKFCEIHREVYALFHLDRLGLKLEGVKDETKG